MKRKAFTLIELIFVIVILGIVALMGADIVSSMYQNYIKTRAINRLQAQTELALEQIAKRLSYRIKRSTGVIRGANIFPLGQAITTDRSLIWIGISNESQLGGWSGFIDLTNPNTNPAVTPKTIQTPGSALNTFARNSIFALSYGDVDLNTVAAKNAALIMKVPRINNAVIANYYSNNANDYTIKVRATAADRFALVGDNVPDYDGNGVRDLYGQYYLSHSAYAIIPQGPADDFSLTLRYNFQPWENETFANGQSAVLAEHVSTFRFLEQGSTIRIKLCIKDDKSAGFDFSACKETVVF